MLLRVQNRDTDQKDEVREREREREEKERTFFCLSCTFRAMLLNFTFYVIK